MVTVKNKQINLVNKQQFSAIAALSFPNLTFSVNDTTTAVTTMLGESGTELRHSTGSLDRREGGGGLIYGH